jgi:hypothetical protein
MLSVIASRIEPLGIDLASTARDYFFVATTIVRWFERFRMR